MKRRIHRIANFFAFNLLFFALYLNFIHTDKMIPTGEEQTIQATAAVSSGAVLLQDISEPNPKP